MNHTEDNSITVFLYLEHVIRYVYFSFLKQVDLSPVICNQELKVAHTERICQNASLSTCACGEEEVRLNKNSPDIK